MSLFGNNAGTSGQSGTGGLFGNNNNTTASTGSSIFGNAAAKPAGSSIFGGGAATNAGTGSGLFGGGGGGGTAAPALSTNNTGPTASTSTNSAPPNSLFGGGSFTLPKPTDQANKDASKPGASSFFSQPTNNSSTPAAGGLFGVPPKPADNAASTATASTSTTTPGSSMFGGGLFGKSAPSTSGATTPALGSTPSFSLGGNKDAAPAPSGGLFGITPKPAEKKDDKASTPTPATGGLFSTSTSKPEEKKDTASSVTGSLGLSTAPSKEGDKPGASTSLGTTSTTPAVAVPPPSMLRGKTIEEIVNKWSNELETHIREFNKFAAEVSMWDRALIENGNNVATLYSHVLAAEREQNEVDQSLNHIEQQQKDLSVTLDAYEKVTQEIFGAQGGSLRALDTGPADTERDKNYMLATDLHTHLDDLSGSLTQMIESVNSLSMPSAPDNLEDPMTQISQILSSHLESLQWIDGAVREVESKVTEVEKRVKESGHAASLGTNGLKSRTFGLR